MPPFINTNCTHCGKPNRFDLEELQKIDSSLIKEPINRDEGEKEAQEEYVKSCQLCGRTFKFIVTGGLNATKK